MAQTANLVTVEAGRLLDLSLNATSATANPTNPINMRLQTAVGTASAAGTGVTGAPGSTGQTIAWTAAGVTSSTANSALITYTSMPVATTTSIELWDSAGTPRRLWFGTLTASKTTASGDTLSFSIASVTAAFPATANLVTVEAGRLLDLCLTGSSGTAVPSTPWKLWLSSTTTSASAAGTEVVAGSGRATITFTGAGTNVTGTTSNSNLISFTTMPAATTTDLNIYDSAGTPRRLWWGPLTASKTTASGDTLSFAIAAITIAIT